jgi:large subunit ribosomal protein L4
MPVVDVKNLDGKIVGKVELADGVFAVRVNPHLLHETSRWYLNSQRAGTHKTKGRAEVQGSGRKLWRQKGTGRARIGSIRSPLWRKGGTVHGPQPRSYAYRLPRKVFLGALRSALSSKLAEEKLTVVDAWQLDSHKAKPFRQALDKLGSESPTILLVETAENHNLELASRNLDGVKLSLSHDLQPYDLLRHDRVLLSKDAAVRLSTVLGPKDGSVVPAAAIEAAKPVAPAEKPAAKKAAKPRADKAAAKKPKAAKKSKAAKAPKGKGKGKE